MPDLHEMSSAVHRLLIALRLSHVTCLPLTAASAPLWTIFAFHMRSEERTVLVLLWASKFS